MEIEKMGVGATRLNFDKQKNQAKNPNENRKRNARPKVKRETNRKSGGQSASGIGKTKMQEFDQTTIELLRRNPVLTESPASFLCFSETLLRFNGDPGFFQRGFEKLFALRQFGSHRQVLALADSDFKRAFRSGNTFQQNAINCFPFF